MRKISSLLLAGALLGSPFVIIPAIAETSDSATTKSPADLAYDAVGALWRVEPPAEIKDSPRERMKFQDESLRRYAAAGRAFGEKYPNDPRRYDFYVQSSFTRPWFIAGFKPEFDASPTPKNLVIDQPALDAFRAEQAKRLTEVIEAPDATPRHRGGAFFALLADARGAAQDHGKTFDLAAHRPLVERVVAKFPDERALPVVDQYVGGLRQTAPAEADAFIASLQAHPTLLAAIKKVEEERRAAAEAQAKKLSDLATLKFTAVDGREVDVAKLKGKVVLIDFWATWCGPCIAELPTVKKVYAKYRERGFEIIGITLERSGVTANDTPAQAEAKMAAAKKKLVDFVAKNEMPWPQQFDGKHFRNEFVEKFGIEAIPAMFLLDKEGRLAATDARGEKLEREVERLLAL